MGGSAPSSLKGPFFEEAHLALIAAQAGQGLAFGDDVPVCDAITAGRPLRVLEASAQSRSYYLLARPGVASSPVTTVFADWLVDECSTFAADQGSGRQAE